MNEPKYNLDMWPAHCALLGTRCDFFPLLSFNRYELYVNDSLLFTDNFDFDASPLILGQPFYMGGIPSSESFQVPYAHCFKGGMKDLIIDTR